MKWRIKFILLVALMSLLVVGGIHLAEKGTQRVDGVLGSSESFDLVRDDRGALEMTVLGRRYAIEDGENSSMVERMDTKWSKIEKETGWLSSVGDIIGEWISIAVQAIESWEKR